ALGSVEYQFPLTANDMFHQVVFCDFGSVESSYRFTDIRVSVGTGLRMLIPAMGPLPLCFDLAFPVEKANGDRVQYFNFTIGAFYGESAGLTTPWRSIKASPPESRWSQADSSRATSPRCNRPPLVTEAYTPTSPPFACAAVRKTPGSCGRSD